jgi:hypothetical protein
MQDQIIRQDRRGRDSWYYEISGIFSVRSMYRLALLHDQEEKRHTGSSTMEDGLSTNVYGQHR